MTEFSYFLSCEEFTPARLVEQARLAERAGFTRLAISDHFHPWNEAQEDFMPIGGRVLAGSGLRTSAAAHREAETAFGRPVTSLTLTDPHLYHQDMALAILSDDQIMHYPAAFTPESNHTPHTLFPRAVLATDEDASVLGLNAISDGRHVLLTDADPDLAAEPHADGLVPIGVRLAELLKAGGGPKCCLLELHPAHQERT
ncbi:dimethylarginine dimethylaminohydrolase family protein [Streptomyces sp. FH025]|uniref:dimethylarginine dimethylaminohydrolase family protein n=1 Tax=Streptomyces sp. FH025 TaxID=2815937 RepID=UPI001A9FC7CE|nr:LLM class flavin-dependent oxidoreductase [Streptomyces sp. FH025]MBO1413295.1 LLM class flavin-dependent oxidoreductase [Streptomyces sp. FH025]